MKLLANIVQIAAWICGTAIILVVLISLFRLTGEHMDHIPNDLKSHVLRYGLLGGLLLAYKWNLIGGIVASLAIVISGFYHPLVMIPGILYITLLVLKRQLLH